MIKNQNLKREELKKVLQAKGYDISEHPISGMEISKNGRYICTLDNDDKFRFNVGDGKGVKAVFDIKENINYYVDAIEGNLCKGISDDDDYKKILAEFNGTILAGTRNANGKYSFSIINDNQPNLPREQFCEDYDKAKLEFAKTSNLINDKMLFSEKELEIFYNILTKIMSIGTDLSHATNKVLTELKEKLEEIVPEVDNKKEEELIKEREEQDEEELDDEIEQ